MKSHKIPTGRRFVKLLFMTVLCAHYYYLAQYLSGFSAIIFTQLGALFLKVNKQWKILYNRKMTIKFSLKWLHQVKQNIKIKMYLSLTIKRSFHHKKSTRMLGKRLISLQESRTKNLLIKCGKRTLMDHRSLNNFSVRTEHL